MSKNKELQQIALPNSAPSADLTRKQIQPAYSSISPLYGFGLDKPLAIQTCRSGGTVQARVQVSATAGQIASQPCWLPGAQALMTSVVRG